MYSSDDLLLLSDVTYSGYSLFHYSNANKYLETQKQITKIETYKNELKHLERRIYLLKSKMKEDVYSFDIKLCTHPQRFTIDRNENHSKHDDFSCELCGKTFEQIR